MIVVDTQWLESNLEASDVAIVDVRAPFFYNQAHILGAVNLPAVFLQDPGGDPPPAERLARILGRTGLTRQDHIVAYDDGESPDAARFYWVMTFYGHPMVSVLDGGITAWRSEGRDWDYTPVAPAETAYEIGSPDGSVIANTAAVQKTIGQPGTVILDVRSAGEFLGFQAVPGQRAGHIPGAINLDWTNNLERDENDVARLKSDDALSAMYRAAGVTPERNVIVHCATGHRASETFLVLRKLGYPSVAMYSPGFSAWQADADTEVER